MIPMTSLCAAESTALHLETLQKNTDALCLFHTQYEVYCLGLHV